MRKKVSNFFLGHPVQHTSLTKVTKCLALIPVKNSVCQLEDLLCRVIGISPEGDDVPVGREIRHTNRDESVTKQPKVKGGAGALLDYKCCLLRAPTYTCHG